MGLFSKKEPCPICGGKIDIFFPRRIEGQLVCDHCYDKLDVQEEILNSFTMSDFRTYLSYYEQNQQLRVRFHTTYSLDYSVFGNDMVFDFDNKLFCTDDKLNKLILSGKDVVSITIREDNSPLFECTRSQIRKYQSAVTERALQMAPQLTQMAANRRLARDMERLTRDEDRGARYIPSVDMPEPFQKFYIHMKLDHPYWQDMRFEVSGPDFSNEYPDVNDYLEEYTEQVTNLEAFIGAFQKLSFSQAAMITENRSAGNAQIAQPPADAIEEIKKYKALMEEGMISAEEFQAKKRQLLGI